ncbi:hypothetical protein NDU88_005390 [Pleurodeles waltl]|uniref:Uncharacterized protein n=1 Tax=Pleurodeles waltl TaxID=8319 RepID=A0AAV7UJ59_PLEWA|nr:hypothetical protein NDU88_005390 [Pleurodeles waltl]
MWGDRRASPASAREWCPAGAPLGSVVCPAAGAWGAPHLISGPTAQLQTPAGTEAPVPHRRILLQHAGVQCYWAAVLSSKSRRSSSVPHRSPFFVLSWITVRPRRQARARQSGPVFRRSDHEPPVRLGASSTRLSEGWHLRGRLRSTPPSPPTTGVSLRTCSQRSAATTAGPLGSTLGPRPCLRQGPERGAPPVGSNLRGLWRLLRTRHAGPVVLIAWGQGDYRIILGRSPPYLELRGGLIGARLLPDLSLDLAT